MKFADTMVLRTESSETGQKNYTVAGLPLSTALVYALLFGVAFWFYGDTVDQRAFYDARFSRLLRVAQDLSRFSCRPVKCAAARLPIVTGTYRDAAGLYFIPLSRCILPLFGCSPLYSTRWA